MNHHTPHFSFDHPRFANNRFNSLIPHDTDDSHIEPRLLLSFYHTDNTFADSEDEGPVDIFIDDKDLDREVEHVDGW